MEKISNEIWVAGKVECNVECQSKEPKLRDAGLYHMKKKYIKSTNFKIILTETERTIFRSTKSVIHLVLVPINIYFSWQCSYFNLKAANLCVPIWMKKRNGNPLAVILHTKDLLKIFFIFPYFSPVFAYYRWHVVFALFTRGPNHSANRATHNNCSLFSLIRIRNHVWWKCWMQFV